GIKVENVRIENMKPPKSVVDAMEKEISAEREQRAAILKAEGEHKVAELHADSERLLIEKRAEATHKVIKDLKSLMPDISDQNIMEFLTKTSYIDSMRELSSSANSKFVLYPSEVQKPMDKVMSAEYMSKAMSSN
ncbi:MAG TPA: SPFH/Band 7/PHB domain protein, partial [Campylobacterales bacterium]|nr:SPFH/Band 7/PHB domain protein [Campylobacterales bacterium]